MTAARTTTTRPRRERPKVLRLTDAAAARIHEIMEKSDGRFIGVRVGVKNGGCAGMSYTMDYAESQNQLDEVVEDKGVRILIDPKAVMFLIGTEMDYAREKLASRFIFRNPNQTEACGCGESVMIRPASPNGESDA
ncbi:MAG: iron-sulfur cluster assembly accessory protein [Alphaproteobacteria bacterium]|nr:iron-sulfur cluster assembly accessory protein [Alphaproteobacteria bacterium]